MQNEIPIVCGEKYNEGEYLMIEMSESEKSNILQDGNLYFVGNKNHQVVMCSGDRSYYVVEEKRSNSLLISQSKMDMENIRVEDNLNLVYQLETKMSNKEDLIQILEQVPYDEKCDIDTSIENLSLVCQQSRVEVLNMLLELNAFEDEEGQWKLLPWNVVQDGFSKIVDGVIELEWDIQDMECGLVAEMLELDDRMVKQCLHVHSIKEKSCYDKGTFCLDEEKIAKFRANELFVEYEQSQMVWVLDDFVEKWSYCVPDQVKIQKEWLKGLAVERKVKGMTKLVYYPTSRLSLNPKMRFQSLFSFQSAWPLHDIEPYLDDIVNDQQTQASLLIKFARASRIPETNDFLYSSRM